MTGLRSSLARFRVKFNFARRDGFTVRGVITKMFKMSARVLSYDCASPLTFSSGRSQLQRAAEEFIDETRDLGVIFHRACFRVSPN